jgi:hypothetical protein
MINIQIRESICDIRLVSFHFLSLYINKIGNFIQKKIKGVDSSCFL